MALRAYLERQKKERMKKLVKENLQAEKKTKRKNYWRACNANYRSWMAPSAKLYELTEQLWKDKTKDGGDCRRKYTCLYSIDLFLKLFVGLFAVGNCVVATPAASVQTCCFFAKKKPISDLEVPLAPMANTMD